MIIALIVIVVIVLLLVLWAVGVYNGLIKLRNLVQEAWRQIDVELTRRHDLIGNLVETVKGYAAHERGTLEDVMKARSAAMAPGQGPAQQAASEGMLTQALGRLIAVAEAYPDLKANTNYLELQRELSDIENKLAAARRFFNSAVGEFNAVRRQFPTVLFAGMVGFGSDKPFFDVGEGDRATMNAAPPKVSFTA